MEHIRFEEERIFAALEIIDPSTLPLVLELRKEHIPILADVGRMFGRLAQLAADLTEGDAETRTLVKAVAARLFAHAAQEDAQLLPLIERHRDAIRNWRP